MIKSNALIQIGSLEHSKAADDYVTNLINILNTRRTSRKIDEG